MKRRICLLLGLILLLLTACSPETGGNLTSIQNDPPPMVAAQVLRPEQKKISCQVELQEISDTVLEQDGTPLVSYQFCLPVMTVSWEDGTPIDPAGTQEERQAAVMAETFNSHFKKWAAEEDLDRSVAEARAELQWRRENAMDWSGGYWLELMTTVYQTDNLVSVAGTYSSDTGGAHPNTWCLGWNFDLTSGTFVSPETLAADVAGFQQAVFEELARQAEPMAGELFWEDYQEILSNWGSYAVSFDEGGMTVAFSPYELACYAAGAQIFTIPYDWLTPHLSEHGRQVLDLGEA